MRALNSILITIVWVWMLIIKRPQIAHIHTNSWTGFYVKAVLGLLVRVAGAKSVMHMHGAEFKEFYAGMGRVRKRLTKGLLNSNSCVIALSDGWREFFESIGVDPNRIFVMPNSVFVPDQIEKDIASAKPCVLFMSAFEKRKGVADLTAALEREPKILQACTIILAGPKTGLWQQIADRIGRMPDSQYVQMPGALTGSDKEHAYRQADCYVLASYNEGMPIGLLEAMSYGLACITTPVGGIPEVVKHMQNGLLVDPGDVDALACAIELLAKHRDLRMRLGAAARQTVETHYNWAHRAKELAHLYQRLLDESQAA